ncbi:MAG: lyase [Gemmatimonadota bacterium]
MMPCFGRLAWLGLAPVCLPAAGALAQVPGGAGQGGPVIVEWKVPHPQSRPRDPYVAPDGRVWFVGQRSDYVAVFDPETESFRKYDLDEGTGPHNLIVAEDGTVYYSGNRAAHIGRLDPRTGRIRKIPMPDPRARDPHTLIWGSTGNIWFTVQGGNYIGHLDVATDRVELIGAPVVESGRGRSSRPYGIKLDSKGRPWVALFNTNLIARVEPASLELPTYELPEGARPRRLAIASDDGVWYVDYARGYLGRLDPVTGEVREWANPDGPGSRPYGMAIDAADRVWFVETGPRPNRFVGFDTKTEQYLSVTALKSGGGSVRHMFYDEPRNAIWFGTDANTIGRAILPPAAGRDR